MNRSDTESQEAVGASLFVGRLVCRRVKRSQISPIDSRGPPSPDSLGPRGGNLVTRPSRGTEAAGTERRSEREPRMGAARTEAECREEVLDRCRSGSLSEFEQTEFASTRASNARRVSDPAASIASRCLSAMDRLARTSYPGSLVTFPSWWIRSTIVMDSLDEHVRHACELPPLRKPNRQVPVAGDLQVGVETADFAEVVRSDELTRVGGDRHPNEQVGIDVTARAGLDALDDGSLAIGDHARRVDAAGGLVAVRHGFDLSFDFSGHHRSSSPRIPINSPRAASIPLFIVRGIPRLRSLVTTRTRSSTAYRSRTSGRARYRSRH